MTNVFIDDFSDMSDPLGGPVITIIQDDPHFSRLIDRARRNPIGEWSDWGTGGLGMGSSPFRGDGCATGVLADDLFGSDFSNPSSPSIGVDDPFNATFPAVDF